MQIKLKYSEMVKKLKTKWKGDWSSVSEYRYKRKIQTDDIQNDLYI